MATSRKSTAAARFAEISDFNLKMARGQQMLERIKDEHVDVATADKVVVFREDKTTLFSLCYAALYPERVKNLILTITPVDFHQDQAEGRANHGLLNLWTRGMSAEDIDCLIEANGNLPGELMSYVFAQMTPGATMSKYNVGLLDTFEDEKKLLNFLRMEKWLADRPHHPGEAAKQLLVNLYKNNELIQGRFELGGRKVNLHDIRIPVLNVYAKDDHIIPPKTTQALRSAVGTKDYSEIGLDGGHVGVFVSGKSQGVLGKGIVDWLAKRD